ncbi:alternative oxidase [Lyngbya aestuarii]|uniref:alternative oxidase n=1 Tax=Lyngbya aestuarii TaxID=118322 RepID=UPI00403D5665
MIKLLVNLLVFVLDNLYKDRTYPRFYVLETVARVPYFAYTSVLHFYETVGLWRKCNWLKVHFAESWNEMHHLLIMESMGGNSYWVDRFLAHFCATLYYWILVFVYAVAPKAAYQFMEEVESHAYTTYDKFLRKHGEELKTLPAPEVALKYYGEGELYMFDAFQTTHKVEPRRPTIENLYDVFVAIRDDELEHVKTMTACQETDTDLNFQAAKTPNKEPA